MITLTREEAQQVLDALNSVWNMDKTLKQCDSIELLDAKLSAPEQIVPLAEYKKLQELVTSQGIRLMEYESQPEPEPVAWMYVNSDGECEQIEYGEPFDDPSVTPLYTAPPQRKECLRCGEINPAEIHTCTPMTVKDIQTSDKNVDEFTKFMKLHRAINGLSQVMLAEKIGVNHSCVGQWERNETSPRWGKVKNLAEIFNVPANEIFTLLSKRKNA